jgi:phenylalanyl-tRNA synthetase beta chain
MKISLDWLKDYVDVDIPCKTLAEKMTMIGLVVETWEERDGDAVMDVETYANRPDTLGHLGMAREIAALLGKPLKERPWPLAELPVRTADLVDVQILDEDLCPRYCGLVVRGVKIGPSPEWLRKRVAAMGLNPVNNVVDVTNYVLFATGQPIHAFDLAKVAGPRILIRRAKKGERLRLLDGREASLTPDMLVIADEKKASAVAGIMGGVESGISDATTDIFIESAVFDPGSIRRTRRALEVLTDASYRFERGADAGFAPQAAHMAASLLSEFGGQVSREMIDLFPRPRKPRELTLRARRTADLLGIDVPADFIEKTLTALGFGLRTRSAGAWMVLVPSHRVDIEREADLIEELARFFGYDRIPTVLPPLQVLEPVPSHEPKLRRLADRLFHYGFDEVINPSFADPERDARLGSGRTAVAIRNPLSARAAILRTSLLGGLLDNAAWNLNRGLEAVHIFETGNIYRRTADDGTAEDLILGLLSTGPLGGAHWKGRPAEADVFHLKGALESVLESLRYETTGLVPKPHPACDPETALAVQVKGETVGWLGRLRGGLAQAFGLKGPAFAAEIDLGRLFKINPRPFEFAPLPKFPAVSRDLSFWVGRDIAYAEIRQAAARLDVAYLEGFDLIDRYDGPNAPDGQVGLSLRFTYRNPKATLTADDADKSEQKVVKALKAAFGIRLREGGSL